VTKSRIVPQLLIYVDDRGSNALVIGVGAGAVVEEVSGHARRSNGRGGYVIPARSVLAVVACAEAWGGGAQMHRLDQTTMRRETG